MTNSFTTIREIGKSINNNKNEQMFYEGIVTEVFKKSKKIKVKLLPEGEKPNIQWARMSFPNASKESIIGAMPQIGSRCWLINVNPPKSQPFSNLIVGGFLFDETVNPPPTSNAETSNDKDAINIVHPNGDKIIIYTDNDGINNIKINCGNDINVYSENNININTNGTLRLGGTQDSQVEEIVRKSHLIDKYNPHIDKILEFIDNFNNGTVLCGMLGILPFSAVMTQTFTQNITTKVGMLQLKDSTNISSKTLVDK